MKNKTLLSTFAFVAALTSGAAQAVAFDSSSLQSVLDGMTVGGHSSVNVENDAIPNDGLWSVSASGGSFSTFVVELSSLAATNKIGIYDAADISKRVTLFNGADTSGDSRLLSIRADGSVFVNFADTGFDIVGNRFGFFLDNGNNVFFSQTGGNADGVDHLFAYRGNGTDSVAVPGGAAGVWGGNEYLMAWEDEYGQTYGDYDDAVIMMESITPTVVEPPFLTIGLLGFGVVLTGLIDRRVKRRQANPDA